ncbi:FKBP-type peptidyl-prolyl cis-trans isomerase [Cognatilysobacter terrigena]|uniref:FKBP-type peptidyl-prolyl cis-trans isomerase n=1 Tax=Cognatilysobacter terrigena TaxID=2488749 RepID=UPI00105C685F|nr:FKBP-type peptidyl-prolyl cis-trans isomerase [Lysobacter terrigena]
MNVSPMRLVALGTLSVALLTAVGCNKDANAPKADTAAANSKDPNAIPGLKDEKARVSYMIGLDMGNTLKQVKDEIDLPTLEKGLKAALDGSKPLMNEQQAQQVREAFAQKLQAKRIADQMQAASKNAKEGQAFFAKNAKAPGVQTTASGLQYQVLTQGTGPKPKADDQVTVNYTGKLLDGTKFDSSEDHGGAATLPLQQVVPGWREGIQLMPVGSKYRLWIPASQGYGETGTPGGPIPPNATLVFDVELVGIANANGAGTSPAH